MKLTLLALFFCTLPLAICAHAQTVSRGIDQAQQAEAQSERNVPPPPVPRRTIDLAKLRHDADELATLAQSVPQDINQTTKGVLPKDLSEKLKRIQKLAKQLQSQVSQ